MTVDAKTDEHMKNFPHRVLIIDDDPMTRMVLRQFFETNGSVVVDDAKDGKDAQDLLERSPAPYDLTTLDLSMPDVDGFEFLSYLKQRNVMMRILIVSSLPATVIKMAETLANFNTLAAIGHLKKPVSASALKAILQNQTWQTHDDEEFPQQATA